MLQLLVSIINDELRDYFREHRAAPLRSRPALRDVMSLSLDTSLPQCVHGAASGDRGGRPMLADRRADSISKDGAQEQFRQQKAAAISSQPGLQDVMSVSLISDPSERVRRPVSDARGHRPAAASQSAESTSLQHGCNGQSTRRIVQLRTEVRGSAVAIHVDIIPSPDTSDLNLVPYATTAITSQSGTASATTSQSSRALSSAEENDMTALAHASTLPQSHIASSTRPESSQAQSGAREDGMAAQGHAGEVSRFAGIRVHAAEQPEPVLEAWRECKNPLDISQAQEVACLMCQKSLSTSMSSFVALSLVLPVLQVSISAFS